MTKKVTEKVTFQKVDVPKSKACYIDISMNFECVSTICEYICWFEMFSYKIRSFLCI